MKLLEKLAGATFENTAFVFDFDGTMIHKFVRFGKIGSTRCPSSVDYETVPSIISILRSEGILGAEYSKESFALSDHYHTIEIDPEIPKEQKIIDMEKWWNKHLELLLDTGLTRGDIEKSSAHPKIVLRTGVTRLLKMAKVKNIPVFIFSASGIGTDAITQFLMSRDLLINNIHIISNSFIFDSSGLAVGRNLPLIHSMNKNEEVLNNFPKEKYLLYSKSHVLLLGDSLEDPNMVSDTNHTNILRVGFLNEQDKTKVAELTPIYEVVYDVVLSTGSEADEIYNYIKSIL